MSKTMNLCGLVACAAVAVFAHPAEAAGFTVIACVGGGQVGAIDGVTGPVFEITP